MNSKKLISNGPKETEEIGKKLSNFILKLKEPGPCLIFLQGELGTGKTTLTRGFVEGFGFKEVVKSPTYTIVELYSSPSIEIHHFDFYQINHIKELSNIGIEEYLNKKDSISIIEWPEKFMGFLPSPDLHIILNHSTKKDEERMLKVFSKINLNLE